MNGQHKVNEAKTWAAPSKDNASLFRPGTEKDRVPQGFVFGKGSLGPGFYSQETRDAYEILLVKMKEKAAYRQQEVNYYSNDGACCFPGSGKNNKSTEKSTAELQLEYATNLVAVVRARLDTTGPFAPLSDDNIRKHGGDPSSVGNSYSFQDLCDLSVTKKTQRVKAYVFVRDGPLILNYLYGI